MIRCAFIFGLLLSSAQTFAHVSLLEEVLVVGKKPKSVGDRTSANEGQITAADIAQLPLARSGDLLEFVPGLVATQHSGSGKANQYFLRGFNLDHGTDFSTNLDFMPLNMVSHGHGQGYTDLNFIIPELIDQINYRKGPYYADAGDFAGSGQASLRSARFLPANQLSLQGGAWGFSRAFAAIQQEQGMGQWLLGAEQQTYQGPWRNVDEDVGKNNIWLKYARGGDQDGLDVSLMSYSNRWNAADQIPTRAVNAGELSPYATVDPSSGGNSERYSLSAQKRWHGENSLWLASAYAIRYQLQLWSNFTYFTRPEGDQIEQVDDRWITGGDIVNTRDGSWAGFKSSYSWGLQWRFDHIEPLGLYHSQARVRTDVIREDNVKQGHAALYWTGAAQWSPRWVSIFNLRLNQYYFNVQATDAAELSTLEDNSGNKSSAIITGGVRTQFALSDNSDLYLNAGRGYHSNDARGVLNRRDPTTAEEVNPAAPLVPLTGFELGANWQSPAKALASSFALWYLTVDSELLFLGDAGTTADSNAKSRRRGIELTSTYQASTEWLLNLDYAYTQAEVLDTDQGRFGPIPEVLPQVLRLSIIKFWGEQWLTSLRWRYASSYSVVEGERAQTSTKWDFNARYQLSNDLTLSLDVLNVFASNDNDIEYWYESQLANESQPVLDRHFRRLEPRNLRMKISYDF